MQYRLFKVTDGSEERVVLAFRVSGEDANSDSEYAFLQECGMADQCTLFMMDLTSRSIHSCFFSWSHPLLRNAHLVIAQQWPHLKSGNIINIETNR